MTETREVHRRAKRSLWLVLTRQMLVALVTFGSGIVLARTFSPAQFGLFAIATFVVVFIGMLADLGIHAALIQRAEQPGTRELRTAFAIRQSTTVPVFVLTWLAAGALPAIYSTASPELGALVRLMSLDLFLLSWCRPSEALLERSLHYDRLVPIDVAAASVYGVVAIVLALGGAGVTSFGVGWLAATATRLALVFRASPWAVGFAWDPRVARELLVAGFPLQVGRVVAQAQYWVTPTVVAGSLGPASAGLLQWAAGNGRKPLEMLEYFARVSLPHFSRLQHEEQELERTLARYVSLFVLCFGLWLSVLATAGRDLVVLVYSERWAPAVPAMVLFAAVGMLVAVRAIITAALAGMGRTMAIARISVASAFAAVIASVALVPLLGVMGVPVGQLIGAAGALAFLVTALGARARSRVMRAAAVVLPPMTSAIGLGLLTNRAPVDAAARGLVTAGLVTMVYCATAWWAGPGWLRDTIRSAISAARARVWGHAQV